MYILWPVLISPLFVDGIILTVESRYDRFLALRICDVCRCRPGAVCLNVGNYVENLRQKAEVGNCVKYEMN